MCRLGLVIAAICLASCSQLGHVGHEYLDPTSYFFSPSAQSALLPTDIQIPFQKLTLRTPFNRQLRGWWIPAEGEAAATVLYLHGREGNLGAYLPAVYWLPHEGFNVLMLDYDGYGGSAQPANLAAAIDDIQNALLYLDLLPSGARKPVILFGQSLGASLGIYAAATSSHRGVIKAVIANGAFATYRGIAVETMDKVPVLSFFGSAVAMLVPDDLSPVEWVRKIAPTPLLLIHEQDDDVVPVHNAGEIFSAAGEPKQLWIIPHAEHIEGIYDFKNRSRLVAFMRKSLGLETPGKSSPPRKHNATSGRNPISIDYVRAGRPRQCAREAATQLVDTSLAADVNTVRSDAASAHMRVLLLGHRGRTDNLQQVAVQIDLQDGDRHEIFGRRYATKVSCDTTLPLSDATCGCEVEALRSAIEQFKDDQIFHDLLGRYLTSGPTAL